MAKILKLNAISPVADKVIPSSYGYSDKEVNPEGIMVRSAQMKEYDFDANPALLAIARAGAGVNNIPCDVCAQKGIVVFNTPGANANAVKELVLCQLLLGGRKIIDAAAWAQTLGSEGENFSKVVEKGKGKFVGQEIIGKTLGVIGLGAIGAAVANSALTLGMKVMGYDPFISVNAAWRLDREVKHVYSTDEIFKNCDFISLHVPATPDTKNLVNKDTLAMCKDGVVIVNDARGELVNTADMIAAVESGKVSRYLTDFGAPEMLGKENIVIFPHLGASTPEAEDNCAFMAANQLVDFIENGNITNSVNYPACSMPRNSAARVTVMHKNVKEILSKITAAVSAEGINIANMQDTSKGEYAYLILDLDEKPSDALIASLSALEDVIRVRAI
ncbi:MAG: phosphoglycerate dehydrogenase [Clostridia bacterium]|nr:phosphoglycerate dehydrogenase [Clostridia bacterium]